MKRILSVFSCLIIPLLVLVSCGDKEPEQAAAPASEPVNLAVEEPVDLAADEPVDLAEPQPEADGAGSMEACVQEAGLAEEPDMPLVFCDNFEDAEATSMPQLEDENKWGALNTEVYNGKYTARVEVKRDNAMWLPVPTEEMRDFYFQLDGTLTSHSGHPYHSWGMYFKADEETENYYYFLIDNNQYYYFQLVRGDRVTNLINGRKSEDLNPLDEGNTIAVSCEGSDYSFYINGKFQEEFSDNRLLSGTLGIYSEMRENTTLDWEFDNMVVFAP